MWARSTRVYATPTTIEQGIDFVRDRVWPQAQQMQGCIGISMIVDRESGLGITTTSWADEQSMIASRPQVAPLREQALQAMGVEDAPAVSEWEIASMHRANPTEPGTCVRVAWSQVPSGMVENAIDYYRTSLLPMIEMLDGFVSASLVVDRAKNLGVTSVAFESREAMVDTRDQADYLRGRSTQDAAVEFLDVGEFELVMAHLHVPELV